ncbi:glycosyltransferase family 2 protein [Faecalibacterium sp. An121]|uniref:glycosyltransferase family 2 protein n=1 Tax=Faecalibacterium sp. An121 TaxID=1965550 RepID=UPI000B3727B9|nr:glycosyltransferase family 2 protein [Faecalibacterium sp. An121]OUQ40792.1 hypothetical protein B5E66_00355 [Faecalibacterium sp. An121]
METNAMISIIIPVYNVENYLNRCIDSVLSQTYKNLEIILIDDGSTDSSSKICDFYQEKDRRVIAYHKRNEGQGIARNYGIDRSKGEYIMFVDSDDWIDPRMCEKLMSLCNTYKRDITGCAYSIDFADGTSKNQFSDSKSGIISGKKCILNVLYQTEDDLGSMCCKLFKRELFDTFRFPSLRNYEDYVISLQLFFAEPDIYFCNLPMYHYYYRIGSSSKSNDFERKIKTIETSYQIKDYFIAHNASKEIIAGSNYFIFKTYNSIFWQLYKIKPSNWKKLIKNHRKVSLFAFKDFLLTSNKKFIDLKYILQYFISICI